MILHLHCYRILDLYYVALYVLYILSTLYETISYIVSRIINVSIYRDHIRTFNHIVFHCIVLYYITAYRIIMIDDMERYTMCKAVFSVLKD